MTVVFAASDDAKLRICIKIKRTVLVKSAILFVASLTYYSVSTNRIDIAKHIHSNTDKSSIPEAK
jgi:hypothetical protein